MYRVRPVPRRLEFTAELHTLRLTTRQRGRSLPQADIAQTNLLQGFEFLVQRRDVGEKLDPIVDCETRALRQCACPCSECPRVSRLKRWPPHVSQVTYTSGRKCISIFSVPCP